MAGLHDSDRSPAALRAALRALLAAPGAIVCPGVVNAWVARQAEEAGFGCVFVTGAGVANTLYGWPDLGLVTLDEQLAVTRRICDAVGVPVIADCDTGYGNHLNVTRTVREFERAGVAGLTLEDQVTPKKCGHFDGKAVVPLRDMVEKIVAAVEARRDPGLVIVGRTDAAGAEGLDGAIERAQAYVAAGADVAFVEVSAALPDVGRVAAEVPAPCLVNMTEGDVPLPSAAELAALGFKIVLYSNTALRVAATAVERAFSRLREEGSSESLLPELWSWEKRQGLVGLPAWEALDRDIAERARQAVGEAGASAGSAVRL